MADEDAPVEGVPIGFVPSAWDAHPVITDTDEGEHWVVAFEVRHAAGVNCWLVEPQAAADFIGKVLEAALRADGENDRLTGRSVTSG